MNAFAKIAGSLLLAAAAVPASQEASISYFTELRDVKISATDRQNYLVLDPQVWQSARSDLADLRLYDGKAQVPYVLKVQRARMSNTEASAKILNLGTVGDHTEFDLDVSAVSQYDRVRLELDAKNFVNTAIVFGADELGKSARTQLGPSTLYDFSRENLGSNFVMKVPTSSFPYLHVKLSPGIRPEQVKSASLFEVQEEKAAWMTVGACAGPTQSGRATVFDCNIPAKVPLDRIAFELPDNLVNFRRNVSIADANGAQIANGDITRVRMKRDGKDISSEELAITIWSPHQEHVTVTIENGDDPPLAIQSVNPLAVERRLYFNPDGKNSLKLYYGDPKLEPPVYDYQKFFQQDASAAQAQLGPEMKNAEFTGRSDERPWSERHKSVMWVAMLAAVALLSGLAVRGLRSSSPTRR